MFSLPCLMRPGHLDPFILCGVRANYFTHTHGAGPMVNVIELSPNYRQQESNWASHDTNK